MGVDAKKLDQNGIFLGHFFRSQNQPTVQPLNCLSLASHQPVTLQPSSANVQTGGRLRDGAGHVFPGSVICGRPLSLGTTSPLRASILKGHGAEHQDRFTEMEPRNCLLPGLFRVANPATKRSLAHRRDLRQGPHDVLPEAADPLRVCGRHRAAEGGGDGDWLAANCAKDWRAMRDEGSVGYPHPPITEWLSRGLEAKAGGAFPATAKVLRGGRTCDDDGDVALDERCGDGTQGSLHQTTAPDVYMPSRAPWEQTVHFVGSVGQENYAWAISDRLQLFLNKLVN